MKEGGPMSQTQDSYFIPVAIAKARCLIVCSVLEEYSHIQVNEVSCKLFVFVFGFCFFWVWSIGTES